jgi:glycosyltransferase involved in cell wall biosynthesis
MQGSKRLLILSLGPFPTPEQTQVEGGGLRCWGLARGLRQNLTGLAITLSFLEAYKKPGHTAEYQSFPIVTWNSEDIPELVAEYDAVLVSFCMGELTVRVADCLRPDQQLILDCYVPIYVEASARDSSDPDREYATFMSEMKSWNHPLLRGDLFLCAHGRQKRFYQGVLSAMGRVNPITYGKELILEVPYGIHREPPAVKDRPISKRLGGSSARRILWFGGIYPWFDFRNLIDAVELANRALPTRLVIVGARNPFTEHPDFLAKYQEVEDYAARPEFRDLVLKQDWVHYDDRADWYLDADLIVVVNKPGDENELAWRTRLVDFAWANVPIVTNGGDPLGEDLIAAGAAVRFPSLDPPAMAETLVSLLDDPARLQRLRDRLQEFKQGLYWDVVTRPLARSIADGKLAPDLRHHSREPLVRPVASAETCSPGRIRKVFHLARKVPAHIRKHGLRVTALGIRARAARQIRRLLPRRQSHRPRIVVLSHRLDVSGAPFVLLDVIERIIRERLGPPLELFSYLPVHESQLHRLKYLGVRLNLLLEPDQVPRLGYGDVVLLNTAGFRPSVRETLLQSLENGVAKKVIWYIHEDEPARHFSGLETERMKRLMRKGRLSIATPARQTTERYRRHFGTDIVREPYRIDLPEIHHAGRDSRDFDTLRFILPGSFEDARKGQGSILYAFAAFYLGQFRDHPEVYRDFTLSFVGLDDGYLSRQVVQHERILGDRLICHPKVTRRRSLELIRAANVTICYSLTEALPIFVYEGMLAGHPLLRNECSGLEEQLEEGRNGLLLESGDFEQVVGTIERILHRGKTRNEQLAAMSARSHQIALRQRLNGYDTLTEMIGSCLHDPGATTRGPHLARRPQPIGPGSPSDPIEVD